MDSPTDRLSPSPLITAAPAPLPPGMRCPTRAPKPPCPASPTAPKASLGPIPFHCQRVELFGPASVPSSPPPPLYFILETALCSLRTLLQPGDSIKPSQRLASPTDGFFGGVVLCWFFFFFPKYFLSQVPFQKERKIEQKKRKSRERGEKKETVLLSFPCMQGN